MASRESYIKSILPKLMNILKIIKENDGIITFEELRKKARVSYDLLIGYIYALKNMGIIQFYKLGKYHVVELLDEDGV